PFEKVVDRVVTTRDMSMSPLFQVMFVLQNTSEGSEGLVLQDVEISNYEFDIVNSKFDLTLNISETNSGIGLDIVYCADLFDKSTIDRMLLHYKELLISILGDITQPVGTLSMLSAEEEEQLLNIFNDTELIYPEDKTIVDLFEEQVKKTPDAIALV
ncbi:condensation domain-containing protein, partial [Flavobacterium collinsii]